MEAVTGTNEESIRRGEEGPTYNIDNGLAPKRRRKRSELTVVEEPDLGQILKGHIVEGSLDTSQGRNSIERFLLDFCLKNRLRFHFVAFS